MQSDEFITLLAAAVCLIVSFVCVLHADATGIRFYMERGMVLMFIIAIPAAIYCFAHIDSWGTE